MPAQASDQHAQLEAYDLYVVLGQPVVYHQRAQHGAEVTFLKQLHRRHATCGCASGDDEMQYACKHRCALHIGGILSSRPQQTRLATLAAS